MQRPFALRLALLSIAALGPVRAQTAKAPAASPDAVLPGKQAAEAAENAPLPDPRALVLDVERNDKRLEALRNNYTYHVHLDEEELKKDGNVKKAVVTDSESVTIDGVRVDKMVARNGQPLTPAEQAKESERIDKAVDKARERQARAANKGEETDDRGDTVLSAARILELGTVSNERRAELNGRPTIVLDYAGDPNAKTHSQVEEIMRDLAGTIWIDEADHVLVRGQGHFLNDFKIGGGLVANVHKGTSFEFQTTHVDEGVWLPATIDAQGSMRLLLFVGFNGRMNLRTSDYRQFRTSATILPGERRVDANGNAVSPAPAADANPGADPAVPKPQQRPQP